MVFPRMNLMFVSLLICVVVYTSSELIPRHCPENFLPGYGNCWCYYEELKSAQGSYIIKSINCTDQHFSSLQSKQRLKELSYALTTHANGKVENVTFVGNTVVELPVNIFGTADLSSLLYLDLSRNVIHTIHGQTFHHMNKLKVLKLSRNQWYVDEASPRVFSSIYNLEKLYLKNAFTNVRKNETQIDHVTHLSTVFKGSKLDFLKELHLESNKLLVVNAEVFQTLPALEKLNLAWNALASVNGLWNSTCLPSKFVPSATKNITCPLKYLDLRFNHIATIPQSFLDELSKLKNFKTLNIHNNRLVCDCHLQDFVNWLKKDVESGKHTVPSYKLLKCHAPEHLKGRPVINMTNEDLVCARSSFEDTRKTHKAAAIVLGIMFGVIGLLLVIALYMHREYVKLKARHVYGSLNSYLPKWRGGYTKVEEPMNPVSV